MFTCMICYSRGEAGRRIWGAKSSWAWATVAVPVINIVVDLLSSCLHWSEEWFLGFTCQDENNTSFLYTFSSWKTIQHWKINWNVHFLKVQAHSAFCSHCLKDANTKFWRQSSHCSRNGKKISVRYLECRINVSDLLCFDPPPLLRSVEVGWRPSHYGCMVWECSPPPLPGVSGVPVSLTQGLQGLSQHEAITQLLMEEIKWKWERKRVEGSRVHPV